VIYFIVRRSIFALALLVAVSFFTYLLFSALPSDPAALTCGKNCTPEVIARNRERLGYDKPLLTQYGLFVKAIFKGRTYGPEGADVHCDAPALGYSFKRHQCVTDLITRSLPVTISLSIGAFVLWMLIGVGLGVLAALKRGRWPDRLATGFSVIGISLPTFFVGLLVILIFTIWWPIIDFPNYVGILKSPLSWAKALILPWATLAVVSASTYVRLTRNGVIEVMNEEFVRLGLAKGVRRPILIVKYVLRAAMVPIVTIAGLDFAALLGGAVITESVFNLPGMGKLAIEAVVDSDLPILVATTLVAAVFIVLANAVVDFCYGFLDPRVRS